MTYDSLILSQHDDRLFSIFRESLSRADRIVFTKDRIDSFMTLYFTYDENICWRFDPCIFPLQHEAYDMRHIV